MTKILISINTSWNIVNFRYGLIKALVAHGYDVVCAAPHDAYTEKLTSLGCRYIELPIDNQGTHPGRDLILLYRYVQIFRTEKPDVYLGYTVKPNVYGSIAAHLLGVSVINNITGLGTAFIKGGWLNKVVRGFYRFALSKSAKVFFQNQDDLKLFISSGLVTQEVTGLLPGSGVDLNKFTPAPLPNQSNIRFLLIARMLWDKGIQEFVDAARILKQQNVNADFCLLGFLDVSNQTAISKIQMDQWVAEGFIKYLGVSDHVSDEVLKADCVVLPSYREGTPRTLLEAAAMARPIITSDTVGCRDVVEDGMNGYLCKVKDAQDLANKMQKILMLTNEEREAMGQIGRLKVECEYDEQIVINMYIEFIKLNQSI